MTRRSRLGELLDVAMCGQIGRRHRFELDDQAVGCGEGVKRLLERCVGFGIAARPLPRQELETRGPLQLPTAAVPADSPPRPRYGGGCSRTVRIVTALSPGAAQATATTTEKG